MVNIVLEGSVQYGVGQTPDGKNKVAQFTDPVSHITVTVALEVVSYRRNNKCGILQQ